MDIPNKKIELEQKFEAIQKELRVIEQAKIQKEQELFRLQGEHRILDELEKEQKDEHGTNKSGDADPSK